MLNYIGIIIGCVCLVLIAVIGYFLYKKIGAQQFTIDQLIERQLVVEGAIMRPSPGSEVQSLVDVTSEECEECDIMPVTFESDSESDTQLPIHNENEIINDGIE